MMLCICSVPEHCELRKVARSQFSCLTRQSAGTRLRAGLLRTRTVDTLEERETFLFLPSVQNGTGTHQLTTGRIPGALPQGKSGRAVMLTANLHLLPR
jgi:hypothetical protein